MNGPSLIDECRRAHPGLVWREASNDVWARIIGGRVHVRLTGSGLYGFVNFGFNDGRSFMRDDVRSLLGALATDCELTRPDVAASLRPHASLRVEVGPDGRAVLPEGWDFATRGLARCHAGNFTSEFDATNGIVTVAHTDRCGDLTAAVALACIYDARRGGA